MKVNFEDDLKDSCDQAAKFLRCKLYEWRKKNKIGDEIYSGEREYVSEVYRLLINRNNSYKYTIFIDYFPYSHGKQRGEKSVRLSKDGKNEGLIPDLVYSDGPENINLVEFKVVVKFKKRGDDSLLYAYDNNDLKDVRKKLDRYNESIISKFIVVAYTGDLNYKDGTKFPLDLLEEQVRGKFGKSDKTKVIVC